MDHPSTPDAGARVQRVVAIAGSLRRGSYNARLLRAAAEFTPAGMRVDIYDGLGDIPLFDEDVEAATQGGPEQVRRLRRRIADADGLLIATPEYNWSVPGVLKNAIDWLSRGPDEVLLKKPVAIIGASSGSWGTRLAQAALRQILAATESAVMPAPVLFVRDAGRRFDADGTLADPAVRDALAAVMSRFGVWIEMNAPAHGRSA